MMRTIWLSGAATFGLICLLTSSAQATKYAGEFLSIGVGPRALGMGGAFVAISDDVTAGYWNPAGLAFLTGPMVGVMHSEQLAGLAYDYAAYAHPRGQGSRRSAFAVSFIRLGVDDIPITRLPDPLAPIDALLSNGQRNRPFVERFVSDVEYALLLSVARRTTSRLSVGGNIKMVRKSVGVAGAFGLGLDAGVLVRPAPSFAIGLHIMNLTTTTLIWDTGEKEYITPRIKVGVVYNCAVKRLRGRFLIAADFDILFEGRKQTASSSLGSASGAAHIGMEYQFNRLVMLRVGAEASGITAGAGLRTPSMTLFGRMMAPRLDYAFVNDNAFGAVHRIGASIEF